MARQPRLPVGDRPLALALRGRDPLDYEGHDGVNMMSIVLRADDAGSSHSADRAILECVGAGHVRNVSFMTPGPTFESAAAAFRKLKGVDFGLHVTLSSEWDRVRWGPVSPPARVRSLVEPDGGFTAGPWVLHERGYCPDEAMAEIAAQLAYAREEGLRVDYLDEHMGVGWIGLHARLAAFAQAEGLVYRPELLGVDLAAQSVDCLPDVLRNAPDAVLSVSHPSHDTREMRLAGNATTSGESVARERDADRRRLTDPRLGPAIAAGGRQSVRYSELPTA